MDWDGLQVFLAVARTGRISAAARRLGVEHTTVSRRLTSLETDLGVPLFYRTTGGYLLTAHGHNALAHAEAMEQAALAVAARAREHGGAVAGQVRVAMAPEFASDWLAPRLGAFRAAHPHIDLQILVGTRQRDLMRGEAELAVQSPRPRQRGLIAARIATTTIALYATRPVARALGGRVTGVDSLGGVPLLAFTKEFHILQDAKWFLPLLASARIAIESNSTHTLLAATRAGLGVGVLPRLSAGACADLVEVSDPVAENDVWLITHPEFRRDPKIRATSDFMKQAAADGGLV